MGSSFKDHFSGGAKSYAEHRPGYPEELFAWVATLTHAHELAWDCATGNGQAAVGVAVHYRHVAASDASAAQIANRRAHPSVDYFVATAERSALREYRCDLVTVAQAAHWFDFERFHAEVRRVLKPGGVIAIWTYETFRIDPAVDAVLDHFYRAVVGLYWPPERRYVEEGYRTLPFPYEEIHAPVFTLEVRWNFEQVLSYLGTWSAVQRFRKDRGFDPVQELQPALAVSWGRPQDDKRISWPLHLRVGRV